MSERAEGRAGDDESRMDCAQLIAGLWILLDGEGTAASRRQLRRHLDDCPECLRHYGLEERIKALIARTCSSERVPEGLRERVRLQISRTTIIRRQG